MKSSSPRPASAVRLFGGLTLCSVLLASPAALAATLLVPSQYATIGAAVSAAASGDTIQVDPSGSPYSAQSILTNKALTIESTGGAASTVINCGSNYFITFTGAGSTLRGFTIANSTSSLGAVSVQAQATIDACVFQNNNSGFNFSPAAINFSGSGTSTVSNCTFTGNTGLGAIEVNSALNITRSTFTNNTGAFGSGAIYANTATINVSDSTFSGNRSDSGDQGGAAYLINGTFHFTRCAFLDNASALAGGAVECGSQGISTPCTFDACLFRGNSAPSGGALGLGVTSSGTTTLTVTDSVFLGNTASSDGPAVLSAGNAAPVVVSLTNSSFYGNQVTGSLAGAGVVGGDGQTRLTVTNSILYGDLAPHELSAAHTAQTTTVSHSDIAQGGLAGANGNIDADPGYLGAASGNLAIGGSSPCANTGTATGAPAADYNGDPWTGGVSMGAYTPLLPSSFSVSAPSSATAGTAFSFTVSALDQHGNVDPAYSGTVHFGSSDGAATLPADAALSNGVGTFSATLATAGAQTLSVSDAAASLTGTSAPISVAPGVPVALVVTAPTTATAGSAFAFVVTAVDALGNTATGYAGTVHLSSTDGQAVLPADAPLSNGTGALGATLASAGVQTLTATDTVDASVSGTSGPINVLAGAAVALGLSAPGSAQAGSAFGATVTATDAYGNAATGYAGTVHFTSSDPQALLPSDLTRAGGSGSASVTLASVGAQSLTAADVADATLTATAPVQVTAAPVADLTVALSLDSGASFVAGGAGTYSITVSNAGSAATTADVSAVDQLPAGLQATALGGQGWSCSLGTLTCTRSDALAAGASFPPISLGVSVAASAPSPLVDQVTVSGGGEADATNDVATLSTPVTFAPVATLEVVAPANAVAGVPLQVSVTARDANGNLAADYLGTIHLTSTDPTAVLGADAPLVQGTGSFAVTLKTAGVQQVTATDTAVPALTQSSGPIGVSPAAAASLQVTAPASAAAGRAFTVAVAADDAYGNVATSYAGPVHLASSDPLAVLPADTALDGGLGALSVTLSTPGEQTLSVTDLVDPSLAGTATLSVDGGPATSTTGGSLGGSTGGGTSTGASTTGYATGSSGSTSASSTGGQGSTSSTGSGGSTTGGTPKGGAKAGCSCNAAGLEEVWGLVLALGALGRTGRGRRPPKRGCELRTAASKPSSV